jgi:CheY-like chemotaxis protein
MIQEAARTSKIVIAEDEAVSRRILEAFLDRAGYQFTSVTNGDEAWRVLNEEAAPRLAILDWMMPGLKGVEVCAKVPMEKSTGRYRDSRACAKILRIPRLGGIVRAMFPL